MNINDPNQPLRSAVEDIAREKAIRAAQDAGRPAPSEAELDAIGKEAEARNVYGYDAKKNSRGEWVAQGIGSKGRESHNHLHQ